jgi:hypothetical protein
MGLPARQAAGLGQGKNVILMFDSLQKPVEGAVMFLPKHFASKGHY